MNEKRSFVALASIFAATACSGDVTLLEGDGTERNGVGRVSQPIVYGDPPDAWYHNAVVGLHNLQGRNRVYTLPFCSGTLIAPDVVLTAGHCVEGSNANPDKVAVYVGDDPRTDLLDNLHFVEAVSSHPDYSPAPISGYLNDIALLRLKAPVSGVTPVSALPSGLGITAADSGVSVNFAGFGDDENGVHGRKLQGDNVIGGIDNPCTATSSSCIGGPGQVWYAQGGGQPAPCFGDSGGPMFLDRGDGTTEDIYVAGVTSYGDSACADYGVSTRSDYFECFIGQFIDPAFDCGVDAGGDGGSGGTGDSGGSGGTSGGTGGSGGSGSGDQCLDIGASCSADTDCCGGKCRGRSGAKSCK